MPFTRTGRHVSMAQFERDEDVWPPRLPPKDKAEQKAREVAEHQRAVLEGKERSAMDADELAFERAADAAQAEQGSIDVKEFDTAESLTERLNKKES